MAEEHSGRGAQWPAISGRWHRFPAPFQFSTSIPAVGGYVNFAGSITVRFPAGPDRLFLPQPTE